VVYDYTPRRTRDGPSRFLTGFRGYLQADAFSGYDGLYAGPDVTEVACWAHVRRKFYEARTSASVPAHAALARIRQLYRIETAAEGFSAEDRSALRQRESVPLLTAFGEWMTEQGRLALPKSPVGQAISYAQANWAALCRYPERGELSIDNNLAERMLRAQAIGRRNWTFLGSDRGGRTAAVLYSLTGTCRHHESTPSPTCRTSSVACRRCLRISSVRSCPTSGSRRTPRHGAREPRKVVERDAESVATNPGADGDTLTVGLSFGSSSASRSCCCFTRPGTPRGVAAGQGPRDFGDLHAFDRRDQVSRSVHSGYALGPGFSWCVPALTCALVGRVPMKTLAKGRHDRRIRLRRCPGHSAPRRTGGLP
jgi:hypothetical protein